MLLMNFLRYNSRHSLFFPGNWAFPQLDPLMTYSHVKDKNGNWTKKFTKQLYEPIWMMRLRHRLFCVVGKHRCRRRGELPLTSPFVYDLKDSEFPDTWDLGPDGYRTCSYCGSLHEEDFWDIAEHYMNDDPNYEIDFSDKNYKVYARKRSTVNAAMGGIKFYLHHVDFQHPEIEYRKSKYSELHRKWKENFNAMISHTRKGVQNDKS